MDLLGEASSTSGRVLTARHVGLERTPLILNDDAVNASVLCQINEVPDVKTYLKAINVYGAILFTFGGVAVLVLFALYCDTMRSVMRCRRADVKTNSALVTAVYPVVGIASYCAMIVPRSQLLAEAITQGVFMVSMYQLFCLIVAYCGGEAEMIRKVKPGRLETRVAPCCCWPCCLIPRPPLDKRTLHCLRLLVLQLPVVQGALYIVLLVMWADEQSLYQVNYMYVQPIVVVSIMCGVWGVVMACRAAESCIEGRGLRLKGKFLALQLVLVAAKLQGTAARLLPASELLPCRAPVTPVVYVNLIYNGLILGEMLRVWAGSLYLQKHPDIAENNTPRIQHVKVIDYIIYNCLILGEMLLLGVWARYLYRNTPDIEENNTPRIQHVKVIDDIPKIATEGIQNRSFDEGRI